MIVVAIIGILAAIAIPAYWWYVQKSRMSALVFPGLHAIESNIALRYATSNTFPTSGMTVFAGDADTKYFTPSFAVYGASQAFQVVLKAGPGNKLNKLSGRSIYAIPQYAEGKISNWRLVGTLAAHMGLAY
jgi:type IV pilus assembly protein PilA